jgi:type VI secretion system ImpA family protein
MTTEPLRPRRDLDPLLIPISKDRPAGEWLRFDAIYDEIRKLREADDPSLPQGVWKKELKRADWHGVDARASSALATRSKDLQLAVWLTEAWLNIDRFAGLAAGLRLITALCRTFWDGLYPPLNGDDIARLGPLAWAVDKLVLPIKSVPITAPKTEDALPYTWADGESAFYYENLGKSQPAAATAAYEQGAVRYSDFLLSSSLTPAPFYTQLTTELEDARQALEELDRTLGEVSGEENPPSLSPMRAPLEAIHTFVSRLLGERVQSGQMAPSPHPLFDEEGAPYTYAPAAPGPPITSRGEAFQRLREGAEFLLRSEPHSPVPYLVLRAVSWEHMPLAELLAELLQKSNDLAAVYSLLGMDKEA